MPESLVMRFKSILLGATFCVAMTPVYAGGSRLPYGFSPCRQDSAGRTGVLTVVATTDRRCTISIPTQGQWKVRPGQPAYLRLPEGVAVLHIKDQSPDPEWPHTDTVHVSAAMLGLVTTFVVHYGSHTRGAVPTALDTFMDLRALSDPGEPGKYDADIDTEVPVYDGGEAAMYLFIAKEVTYPEADRRSGIEGRVVLQLDVDRSGTVRSVSTIQSVSATLDAEARRVALMLHFIPARRKGRAIPAMIQVPVTFKL